MRLTFLGTGAAWGHPVIAKHDCRACDYTKRNPNHKDFRTRSALLLQTDDKNILIDAGPDIRNQLQREKIDRIDALFITHAHSDHFNGLDDLGPFRSSLGSPIPTFATNSVWEIISQKFGYMIESSLERHIISSSRISDHPLDGMEIFAVEVYHGPEKFGSGGAVGFVFQFAEKKLAYTGDIYNFGKDENTNPDPNSDSIPEIFFNASVLIFETNWFNEPFKQSPNPHMSFQRALEYFRRLKANKMYLTHLSHEDWSKPDNHDPTKLTNPLQLPPPVNHAQWQKMASEEGKKKQVCDINVAFDGLQITI